MSDSYDWGAHPAPSVLADLRALCESIRNPPPEQRKRMVYTSKGWWEFVPSAQGVFAIHYGSRCFRGMFRFTESRRRRHSRVFKDWFDGRCERC